MLGTDINICHNHNNKKCTTAEIVAAVLSLIVRHTQWNVILVFYLLTPYDQYPDLGRLVLWSAAIFVGWLSSRGVRVVVAAVAACTERYLTLSRLRSFGSCNSQKQTFSPGRRLGRRQGRRLASADA